LHKSLVLISLFTIMKILFVTRVNSIHAARWIAQFSGSPWEVALFPATGHRCHPELSNIRSFDAFSNWWERHVRVDLKWPAKVRGMTRLRALLQKGLPHRRGRAARLAHIIRQWKPDIIHSLEMQHAGYLTLEAKRLFEGRFPSWIVQNWGSDIYLFQHLPGHPERIRDVLRECDYYDCECERDVQLARAHGFSGCVLPVRPNGGGFDLAKIESLKSAGMTSNRKVIAVKGYQGWAGRALVALTALERVASKGLLSGYRVVIYNALTEDVNIAAHLFMDRTKVPVDFVPPDSPHIDILRMHGTARLSIGLSISDGISISLLEAMLMGSFPIQSNTGAALEWIRDGVTGLVVSPEDPYVVADAIERVLKDDQLVNEAASENAVTANVRLDGDKIREQVLKMYAGVLVAIRQ
jgi:hypothetical protein